MPGFAGSYIEKNYEHTVVCLCSFTVIFSVKVQDLEGFFFSIPLRPVTWWQVETVPRFGQPVLVHISAVPVEDMTSFSCGLLLTQWNLILPPAEESGVSVESRHHFILLCSTMLHMLTSLPCVSVLIHPYSCCAQVVSPFVQGRGRKKVENG